MIKILAGIVLLVSLQATLYAADVVNRTITVYGKAEAVAKPDQIRVRVGISVTEAKLSDAKAKSDEAMRNLLKLTKQLKIEPRDVQTDFAQIQVYREGPDPQVRGSKPQTRYHAQREATILLRDLDRYDELMDTLFSSGINQLNSVQFESSQQSKLEAESRRLALKDGKAKAEEMANEMGLKLGRPLSIAEGISEPPRMQEMFLTKSMARGMEADSATTMAPGEIRVESAVTLIFAAEAK